MKNVSTLDRKLQTLLPGSLSQYPQDRFENYFGAVERERRKTEGSLVVGMSLTVLTLTEGIGRRSIRRHARIGREKQRLA